MANFPFYIPVVSSIPSFCFGEKPLALPRDLDGECMGLQSKFQDLTVTINYNSFERETNLPFHIPEV